MTKQRKLYAAFLGLAAVAFVCDRAFFAPAGAGAAPVAPEAAAERTPEAVKPTEAAPSGPTLAAKLQNAAPREGSSRDPFRGGSQGGTPAAAAGPVTMEAATAAEFLARYELQSILKPRSGQGKAVAVVARRGGDARESGRPYPVGMSIGGWELVEVGDHSAAFERASVRATLDLKQTPQVDNVDVTRKTPSN